VIARLSALLVLLIAASAAAEPYTIVKLLPLSPYVGDVDLALADDGSLAVVEQDGAFTESLYWVTRGKTLRNITNAGSSTNPQSNLRLRGINGSGTVLYSVDYRPGEPLTRAIRTWKDRGVPLLIRGHASGAAGDLDPFPSLNYADQVGFHEWDGSSYLLRLSNGGAVQPPLAACGFIGRVALVGFFGALSFDCSSSMFSPTSIYTAVFGSVFSSIGDGSFGILGELGGFHSPVEGNALGTLLFARFGAAPEGYFVTTSGGPVFVGEMYGTLDIEIDDSDRVMRLDDSSGGITVQAGAMVSPVVDIGSSLDGATITGMYTAPSMNGLGQIAFAALLSNGTQGIYLAAPASCDSDLDGWCAHDDNCPGYTDPSQIDSDGDGFGDRCDNCPMVPNPDQADANVDGRGDACAPCGPSNPAVPVCGTRTKGPGTEVFSVGPISVASVPPRPSLYGRAKSLTSGLVVDVRISGCTGGVHSSFAQLETLYDGDGLTAGPLYFLYLDTADRIGASCSLEFQASGAAGSYEYLVDSATVTPRSGDTYYDSTGAPVAGTAAMPGAIPFMNESDNHRFLYAGTGGASFGTCNWNPDPPQGDDPPVVYSGASGTGWDCCTFQFDGVDGVPSSVGQLVFNLNGPLPPPDPDADGFLSPCDSCDFKANVDQKDGGGVGTSNPDLIGDACQCGRLDADGIVNGLDVTALRKHLARNPVLTSAQLPFCSVIGGPTECTIRTATVLRRALGTPALGPFVQQTCQAAQP